MSTHDYRRAVDYYRKALRGQPNSIPLRHDLARLCLKLGRFDDAGEVLREVSHVSETSYPTIAVVRKNPTFVCRAEASGLLFRWLCTLS